MRLEEKLEEINESILKLELEEEEESERIPFAMIMDLSDVVPGELELEDEIRMGYLRQKYKK